MDPGRQFLETTVYSIHYLHFLKIFLGQICISVQRTANCSGNRLFSEDGAQAGIGFLFIFFSP